MTCNPICTASVYVLAKDIVLKGDTLPKFLAQGFESLTLKKGDYLTYDGRDGDELVFKFSRTPPQKAMLAHFRLKLTEDQVSAIDYQVLAFTPTGAVCVAPNGTVIEHPLGRLHVEVG